MLDGFDLVSQPVIAAENSTIKYMNPPAIRIFGECCTGKLVSFLLPEEIIGVQASSFMAGVEIMGISCTLRTCRVEKLQLYIIEPVVNDFGRHTTLFAAIRGNLANIKIAADRMSEAVSPAQGSSFQRYHSALTHNYYQLKRLAINLSAAEGIACDSLVFTPRATDFTTLCEEIVSAISPFAFENGIAVSFSSSKHITCVADAELIELMLLNLLSNSLIHTPAGGHVKLSLSDISNYVMLTVTDSGYGIPPDEIDTVFSKYRSDISLAKLNSGTGLGLTVARGIAEKHGGVMILESHPGIGTTVRITISKKIFSPTPSRPQRSGIRQRAWTIYSPNYPHGLRRNAIKKNIRTKKASSRVGACFLVEVHLPEL